MKDVIVIGAGAAGLSAGLVLARARADVLLIDAGQPRNAPAAEMHGFLSRDGMPPAELLAAGRREVTGYGGVVVSGSVTAIAQRDNSFRVTVNDAVVTARALLVTTGLTDELPPIPGVAERWGTLVHHCPYCHGFEVSNQQVVVIGGPMREVTLRQAALLRSYTDRVTLLTHGIELERNERRRLEAFGVRVVDGAASTLLGSPGSLDAVALTDNTRLDCDAVFIAPRQRPNDALLRSLGCVVNAESGLVSADAFGATSVSGVWAAGNVVTPTAQVITAAGAASASAIAINGWLVNKRLSKEQHD